MVETEILNEQESRELKMLEKYLPALSGRSRAYLKGMTEALFYAQEAQFVTKVEQTVSACGIIKTANIEICTNNRKKPQIKR